VTETVCAAFIETRCIILSSFYWKTSVDKPLWMH